MQGIGGSLDEKTFGDDGERGKYNPVLAKKEQDRIADEEALARALERREAVRAAIDRLDDPRKRRVLELTLEGCPTTMIVAQLGETRDNVYQLRSRALRDLADIVHLNEQD